MTLRLKLTILTTFLLMVMIQAGAQKGKHTFSFGGTEFLLDGKPFQIISGELHPARIPAEYWRHRIQMAKAMGCNTISVYVFWNYHETQEGVYDFSAGNRNIAEFFRLVQEEGMWLIVKPGPYVCAEWDLGGIPPYLLRIPDIKLKCMDPRYMAAAEKYIARLAQELKPFQVTNGGPLLMIRIENEYGSFDSEQNCMLRLREAWKENGIVVPTFTADGPTTEMLEAGSLPGNVVRLGSLTHWGEPWARTDTSKLLREVKFLMDSKKSFNLYIIHGGTNFGYTAGANSGGKGYEPAVTSYDYDASVDEQGHPTPKYFALRKLIGSYLPKKQKLPEIPAPNPVIELTPFGVQPFTTFWDHLPAPFNSEQPKPFEAYNQDHGFILYRTDLKGTKKGRLIVNEVHDYATVFLNGKYIGKLDRREGVNSIEIPESSVETPVLDIFVEGMGRINDGQNMIDRKGITDHVTLDGGILMNWKIYNLPMDEKFVYNLRSSGRNLDKPGIFFRGSFMINRSAGVGRGDTFIDVSNFTKGIVWVNGRNLGRFWNIGPQKRLYCPATWIREGMNEIMIFDLHETSPKIVSGWKTME